MTEHQPEAIPIELARLRANEEFQPRYDGLDADHVRRLMQSEPDDWSPLLVVPNELGGYDIIDGFHRFEVASRLGIATLPCVIRPDADYPDAVAANVRHGLPLKVEDRKMAARYWHSVDPGLSYRAIGRRCGLNHETVKRAIETETSAGSAAQRSRPDPIARLVSHVYRTYADGHGRTWLGFGREGNPKPFRTAIEGYRDEDRAVIAKAIDAFGRACVAAAEPYLPDAQ
jgi:hypothetical protein